MFSTLPNCLNWEPLQKRRPRCSTFESLSNRPCITLQGPCSSVPTPDSSNEDKSLSWNLIFTSLKMFPCGSSRAFQITSQEKNFSQFPLNKKWTEMACPCSNKHFAYITRHLSEQLEMSPWDATVINMTACSVTESMLDETISKANPTNTKAKAMSQKQWIQTKEERKQNIARQTKSNQTSHQKNKKWKTKFKTN